MDNPSIVPTFDKLMWPALQALVDIGGSATIQEHLDKVVEIMDLSDEVQNDLHGDGPQTKVAYRLAWARTYLGKAGALENSTRGVWSITPEGRALTEAEVANIPVTVRSLYQEARKREGDEENVEASWKDELLEILQSMPPDSFERLSQRILRESGFVKVEVRGKSGDGGIDGIGVLRINLLSFQVFFQCKRYQGTVSAGAIRDFRGAMVGRTDKGLLITTGRFTPDATREATRDGAPPIDLIDGDQLCDILKDLGLGVTTETVEEVRVHSETFRDI
jgi:restriction system protein